jgi:hypothetical protein
MTNNMLAIYYLLNSLSDEKALENMDGVDIVMMGFVNIFVFVVLLYKSKLIN